MNDNHPTPAQQTHDHFQLTHSEFSAQLKARFPDGPVRVQTQQRKSAAAKLAHLFGGKK